MCGGRCGFATSDGDVCVACTQSLAPSLAERGRGRGREKGGEGEGEREIQW